MGVMAEYRNRNPRGHWFDPDTMRFFRTRVSDRQYWHRNSDRWVFVTSEKPPHGERFHTVRIMDKRGDIHTFAGDFTESMGRGMNSTTAHRIAKELGTRGRVRWNGQSYSLTDFGKGRRSRRIVAPSTLRTEER